MAGRYRRGRVHPEVVAGRNSRLEQVYQSGRTLKISVYCKSGTNSNVN